ncbi:MULTISPECIES: flagellar basal body P-ring formation chaperone FlgA [Giesbergeria]|uniref:Flagellar basal body P-ring formation chaperone FlgA n=1 Tax=Giesbergeria sinuosa TaxID=80883 RepID=A0ABV9QE90_9BURK
MLVALVSVPVLLCRWRVACVGVARRWAWLLAWLCSAGVSWAQQPGIEETTRQWVEQMLHSTQAASQMAVPLRMEVVVGALDPRLRLAPCERIEPYLPTGTRLWGRSRLGLRCAIGPSRWNVFLPITIKAHGPAWVLTGPVALGAVLSQADAAQAEVDWAAEVDMVVADPAQWVGKVAARSLSAGQALRQSMLRAPRLFQAGAQVRVLSKGGGFAISGSGQAMGAAGAGDTVRVRMPNGKIITGVVNEDGWVETQF